MTVYGMGFGQNPAALQFRFEGGSGPEPACQAVAAMFATAVCEFTVWPGTSGRWRMHMYIGVHRWYNVTAIETAAMPGPEVHGVSGCAPGGCRGTDVLAIRGRYFNPHDLRSNRIRFDPTPAAVGPPPTCALTHANLTVILCVLSQAPATGGRWTLIAEVLGQASAGNPFPMPPAPGVPWIDAVAACGAAPHAPGDVCRSRRALTVRGRGLKFGAAVQFAAGDDAYAPSAQAAPRCATANAVAGVEVVCALVVPPYVNGTWLVSVAAAGALSNALPVALEALPQATIADVQGCSSPACLFGDVLTVTGQHFDERATVITFAATSTAQGPAPWCPVRHVTASSIVCEMQVPVNASGAWTLAVEVLQWASANSALLTVAGAAPASVTDVTCAGQVIDAGTIECNAGTPVTVTGSGFGSNASRVAVHFSGGTGAAPTCVPLAVQPQLLECGLSAHPASTGPWTVTLRVHGAVTREAAFPFRIDTVPLASPVVSAVGGCPADGCHNGSTLSIVGDHFDPYVPSNNVVQLTSTPPSALSCAPQDSTATSITCVLLGPGGAAQSTATVAVSVLGVSTGAGPSLTVQASALRPLVRALSCGAGLDIPTAKLACSGGQVVTILGRNFGADLAAVQVSVRPASAAAAVMPAPLCLPQRLLPGRVLCRLATSPAADAAGWSFHVTVGAWSAEGAARARLGPARAPVVHGVSGCTGMGCGPGGVLTVLGQGFDPSAPANNVVTFTRDFLAEGPTAPQCTPLSSNCTHLTCALAVPAATHGNWAAGVTAFGVPSDSTATVRLHSSGPVLREYACAAAQAYPPPPADCPNSPDPYALVCPSGHLLHLRGLNFGDDPAAVAVQFFGGSGQVPACDVVSVEPGLIQCALFVPPPTTVREWVVAVAVQGNASNALWSRVVVKGFPLPEIHAVSGCPAAGCMDGDVLTLRGAYFWAYAKEQNVVVLGNAYGQGLGPVPGCAVVAANRTHLRCALSAPTATSGGWSVGVAVRGRADGANYPLRVEVRGGRPYIEAVECGGALAAAQCASGDRVVFRGGYYGANASRVAVRFLSSGAGAPQCVPLRVTPRALECALVVPATARGAWGLQLWVNPTGGANGQGLLSDSLILTLEPQPAPLLQSAACARGCYPGATLTLSGTHFHALWPGAHVVTVSPSNASAAAALQCTPAASTGNTLECRLSGTATPQGMVWDVALSVAQATAQGTASVSVADGPTAAVAGVRCAAYSTLASAGLGCLGGHPLQLSGTGLSTATGAGAVVQFPGTAPPPACPALDATPTALTCALTVPPSAPAAALPTAVGPTAAVQLQLPVLPPPPAIILGYEGCVPLEGCGRGDVLTITGLHLDPFRLTHHTILFEPTANSAGPAPSCEPQSIAAVPELLCAATAPQAIALHCAFARDRLTAGLWMLHVAVQGVRSEGYPFPLATWTYTPTATATPTGTPTQTSIPRRIALLPGYVPADEVYAGTKQPVSLVVADSGDTEVRITIARAGTLHPTASAIAAGCTFAGASATCALGRQPVEVTVLLLLEASRDYYQELQPIGGIYRLQVEAQLWSADQPGEPRRYYFSTRYEPQVHGGDLHIAWQDHTSGTLLLPGDDIPLVVAVENRGQGYVAQPEVRILLPDLGLTLRPDAAVTSQGFPDPVPVVCAASQGGLEQVCTMPELAPQTSVVLRYDGVAAKDTFQGALQVTATATAATTDANVTDNTDAMVLDVGTAPIFELSTAGTDLSLTFPGDIRVEGESVGAVVPADQLFEPPGAARLGNGSQCEWLGLRYIRVSLGLDSSLQPGDSLALFPLVVFPVAQPVFNGFRATVVLPGPVPLPVARLLAPGAAAVCDPVTLDATASQVSTRRRRIAWDYMPPPGAGPEATVLRALRDFLASSADRPLVTVPAALLVDAGEHAFTVTVSDYFGAASSAARVVFRSVGRTPAVQVDTPSPVTLRATQYAAFTAAGTVSACAVDSAPQAPAPSLAYRWEAVSHPGVLDALPRDRARLAVPPAALRPGNMYTFLVTVTDQSTGLSAVDNVRVVVDRAPLVLRVTGGSQRRMGTLGVLALDASETYDPDAAPGSATLDFQWGACYEGPSSLVAPERGGICNPVPLNAPGSGLPQPLVTSAAAQPHVQLRGTQEAPFPTGWWKFAVTVRSGPRTAAGAVFVNFAAVAPLTVAIVRDGPPGAGAIHNADQRLLLRAELSQSPVNVQLRWSSLTQSGRPLDLNAAAVAPLGARASTLMLTPRALQGLTALHVELTASIARESVTAEAVVVLNQPPTGGTLQVSIEGVGAEQRVVLRALGWVDDASQQLLYQFSYYRPGSRAPVGLRALQSDPSPVNTLTTALGPLDVWTELVFQVRVADALGAVAVRNATAPVSPTGLPTAVVPSVLDRVAAAPSPDTIAAVLDYIDAEAVAQAIGDRAALDALAAVPRATLAAQLVAAANAATPLTSAQAQTWLIASVAMSIEVKQFGESSAAQLLSTAADLVWAATVAATPAEALQFAQLGIELIGNMLRKFAPAQPAPGIAASQPLPNPTALRADINLMLERIGLRAVAYSLAAPGGEPTCYGAAGLAWCFSRLKPGSALVQSQPGLAVEVASTWAEAALSGGQPVGYDTPVGLNAFYFPKNINGLAGAVLNPQTAGADVQLGSVSIGPVVNFTLTVPQNLNSTVPVACAYVVESTPPFVSMRGVVQFQSQVGSAATVVDCGAEHTTEFLVALDLGFIASGPPPRVLHIGPRPALVPLYVWLLYGGFLVLHAYARRGGEPVKYGGAVPGGRATAAWLFLRWHLWLAALAEFRHGPTPRQVTVILMTVLGALMGTALFSDSLAPGAAAVLALLLLLPFRGLVSAVFRFSPRQRPLQVAAHAHVRAARGAVRDLPAANPLAKPVISAAHLKGILQRVASDPPDRALASRESQITSEGSWGRRTPLGSFSRRLHSAQSGGSQADDELDASAPRTPPSGFSARLMALGQTPVAVLDPDATESDALVVRSRPGSGSPLTPPSKPPLALAALTALDTSDDADSDGELARPVALTMPRPRSAGSVRPPSGGSERPLSAGSGRLPSSRGSTRSERRGTPPLGLAVPLTTLEAPRTGAGGSELLGAVLGVRAQRTHVLDLIRKTKGVAGPEGVAGYWDSGTDSDDPERSLEQMTVLRKEPPPGVLGAVGAGTGGMHTELVLQAVRAGHMVVACHMLLRITESVAQAQAMCADMMDWTPQELKKRWDADEARCPIWAQGMDEVKKHDWHAAKAFFYGSLLSRNIGGIPVSGISPDRMTPWLAYYSERLLGMSQAGFAGMYRAHAGETVDVMRPMFPGKVVMGLPAPVDGVPARYGVAKTVDEVPVPVSPSVQSVASGGRRFSLLGTAASTGVVAPARRTKARRYRGRSGSLTYSPQPTGPSKAQIEEAEAAIGHRLRPAGGLDLQSVDTSTTIFVRNHPHATDAERAESTGARFSPYFSLADAFRSPEACDHCEIVLLDGRYPPLRVRCPYRHVLIRAASNDTVVVARAAESRPETALISVDDTTGLCIADLRFEAAAFGVVGTNSPDLVVLNCTFVDVATPIHDTVRAHSLHEIRTTNTLEYSTWGQQLAHWRLPYWSAKWGFGFAMAYAVICTALAVWKIAASETVTLSEWLLLTGLCLVLDIVLLQSLVAAVALAVRHMFLSAPEGPPAPPPFTAPQLNAPAALAMRQAPPPEPAVPSFLVPGLAEPEAPRQPGPAAAGRAALYEVMNPPQRPSQRASVSSALRQVVTPQDGPSRRPSIASEAPRRSTSSEQAMP